MFVQLTKSLLCSYSDTGGYLNEDVHPGNVEVISKADFFLLISSLVLEWRASGLCGSVIGSIYDLFSISRTECARVAVPLQETGYQVSFIFLDPYK